MKIRQSYKTFCKLKRLVFTSILSREKCACLKAVMMHTPAALCHGTPSLRLTIAMRFPGYTTGYAPSAASASAGDKGASFFFSSSFARLLNSGYCMRVW